MVDGHERVKDGVIHMKRGLCNIYLAHESYSLVQGSGVNKDPHLTEEPADLTETMDQVSH